MKQYLELVQRTLENGVLQENRTGVDTLTVPGDMMRFDLSKDGFPAITTKKLAFKSLIGELCAFLRASRSAADFRALGSKVWDANANDPGKEGSPNAWLTNPFREGEDDLGPVYGVQWREWPGFKWFDYNDTPSPEAHAKLIAEGWTLRAVHDSSACIDGVLYYKAIDQLGECIRTIIKSPTNRRILFHGWNPAVLDQVALPACHLLYQFLPHVGTKKLNMVVYLRSSDVGLGVPFNKAQAASLMSLVARLTGYDVGVMTMFMADCHIYVDQIDYLKEQLTKEPFPAPKLVISDRIPKWIDPSPVELTGDLIADAGRQHGRQQVIDLAIEHSISFLSEVTPDDFTLEGYQYHELTTERPKMAV